MKDLFYKALLVLCILFSTFSIALAAETLPKPVGKVVWIKGDSLTATMQNQEARDLKKNSIIYLYDVLKTGANTTAEIIFTDNTLITFKPETTFSINEYDFKPGQKNSMGKSVMNLIEGGFRTITGLIAKTNPDDYEVKTPVATIGVRGTDYATYIDNGHVFLGHYDGSPCISNAKGKTCVDKNRPYAKVTDFMIAPVFLDEMPEGFREKLEITPAKMETFDEGVQTGKIGGDRGNGGTTGGGSKGKGGVSSGFCIQ